MAVPINAYGYDGSDSSGRSVIVDVNCRFAVFVSRAVCANRRLINCPIGLAGSLRCDVSDIASFPCYLLLQTKPKYEKCDQDSLNGGCNDDNYLFYTFLL